MKVTFDSMELFDEDHMVKILGQSQEMMVTIEMSILQLAVLFNTDKKILAEMNAAGGFGDHWLEERCVETRELVKNYPKINFTDNKITSSLSSNLYFQAYDKDGDENYGLISFEDLCGWGNEGINIILPKGIYDKFADKNIQIELKQTEITINLIQ